MRKTLLLALLLSMLFITGTFAQSDSVRITTKYENFVNNGLFIKIIDTKPISTSLSFGPKFIKSFVRKVITEHGINYYLVLTNKNEYLGYRPKGIDNAFIEYSDLKEINKAIDKLIKDEPNDCELQPHYLENFFKINDGFIVGYTVSKKKTSWLIRLNESNLSFITNIDYKEKLFEILNNAQKDIEEMMAKDK